MEKARELQEKHIFLLLDYIKTYNHVDHSKLWKILRDEVPDDLACFLRILYVGQEATVRARHLSGSKFGKKDYNKAVNTVTVYLTYMQSTSCKMPSWMNHKLESRLPGEISTTSDIQMIPL